MREDSEIGGGRAGGGFEGRGEMLNCFLGEWLVNGLGKYSVVLGSFKGLF